MSYQSIPLALPDPSYQQPSNVNAPISGVTHISGAQTIAFTVPASNTTVSAGQCLCPFIINNSSGGPCAIRLPDAFTLSNAYGNNDAINAIGVLIPGFSPLPSTQVQVGDVFAIPLVVQSTSNAQVIWGSGTGGSGAHITHNFDTTLGRDTLVIQFTAVGPSIDTCSYVLQ
jgi:hypothetical protein